MYLQSPGSEKEGEGKKARLENGKHYSASGEPDSGRSSSSSSSAFRPWSPNLLNILKEGKVSYCFSILYHPLSDLMTRCVNRGVLSFYPNLYRDYFILWTTLSEDIVSCKNRCTLLSMRDFKKKHGWPISYLLCMACILLGSSFGFT